MRRRTFIQQSGLAVSAAMLPLTCFSSSAQPKYKMGFQLYSIRDAIAKDPINTFKTVASLGFTDLETYGYDVENDSYYGYKSSELKTVFDDLGMEASSGHYGFSNYFRASEDDLRRFVDACIKGAKTLGKSYITWPWLAPEY